MDNDTVKTISGSIGFNYPLSMMIEQFGPPTGVRSLQAFTRCTACEMWWSPEPDNLNAEEEGRLIEDPWPILVYFLYPEQGLLFWGWIPENNVGCLCPTIPIRAFCYFEPISLSEAFEDNRLADLCLPVLENFTENDIIPWHGFGGGY